MIHNTLHFNADITGAEEKFLNGIYEKIVHEKESGEIGYYVLPETQLPMVDAIEKFAEESALVSNNELENIVVIGIGGSSLGAKAIDTMLSHLPNRNKVNLQFLENCDPIFLSGVFNKLDGDKTLFIMISKSGSTIETTSVTKYIISHFGLEVGSEKMKKHFVTVTDPGSPLDQFSTANGVQAFHLPKNVGGRFSVMTAVGLLPLCLCGYDVRKLLGGAQALHDKFFSKNMDELLKKAYFYAKHATQYRTNVLFTYSTLAYHMNAWYVQLWGESLGKLDVQERKVGLTPVGLVGSVDQHSFLQLIVQGPEDKTVTFVKVKDFGIDMTIPDVTIPNLEKTNYVNGKPYQTLINAQCDATMETLIEQGVPCDLIEVDCLNEENAGMLLFYYELLTSCTGACLAVNTYDQPGVEFGKKRLVEKFS